MENPNVIEESVVSPIRPPVTAVVRPRPVEEEQREAKKARLMAKVESDGIKKRDFEMEEVTKPVPKRVRRSLDLDAADGIATCASFSTKTAAGRASIRLMAAVNSAKRSHDLGSTKGGSAKRCSLAHPLQLCGGPSNPHAMHTSSMASKQPPAFPPVDYNMEVNLICDMLNTKKITPFIMGGK